MNDILPKPFTKEGLLDMLEVAIVFMHTHLLTHMAIVETSYAPQGHPANVQSPTLSGHPTTQ